MAKTLGSSLSFHSINSYIIFDSLSVQKLSCTKPIKIKYRNIFHTQYQRILPYLLKDKFKSRQ